MDSRLLTLLPTEQARCREIARHYSAMGSIGCFAAAMIEQTLQRADRAIIEGGEDTIRNVLRDLQAFDMARQPAATLSAADRPLPGKPRLAVAIPPVGRRMGRMAPAGAVAWAA
jgi:hypothetical protein